MLVGSGADEGAISVEAAGTLVEVAGADWFDASFEFRSAITIGRITAVDTAARRIRGLGPRREPRRDEPIGIMAPQYSLRIYRSARPLPRLPRQGPR